MRQSVNAVKKERPDIFNFLKGNEPLELLFNMDTPLTKERVKLYKECYKNIGNTPVYKINLRKNNNFLYTKLEYRNEFGNNHYSRYWFVYLFIAETLGLIKEGDSILEVTSGSSGVALSKACQILNYSLTILVPDAITSARISAMEGNNITVIRSNGYLDKCVEDMKRMREDTDKDYFTPNHAEEKSDIIVDVFKRIAIEFKAQTNFIPDSVLLALGNGTSARGIVEYFSKQSDCPPITIGFHPDLNVANFKPILGLRPPKVKFRHIDSVEDSLSKIEYTDNLNIEVIRQKYFYDDEIKNFGITSLYGISLALQCADYVRDSSFFSIAYDKINMYDNG